MRRATATRLDALPLLVTRQVLQHSGIDLDVALRATRSGRWTQILPGAWLQRDLAVTREHRQQAALALLGTHAALTGPDACREYGLRDVPDEHRVTVLVPHTVQRDLGPHVRLVRSTVPAHSYQMRGRRWVEPARAVYDTSTGRSLREVRGLVDQSS